MEKVKLGKQGSWVLAYFSGKWPTVQKTLSFYDNWEKIKCKEGRKAFVCKGIELPKGLWLIEKLNQMRSTIGGEWGKRQSECEGKEVKLVGTGLWESSFSLKLSLTTQTQKKYLPVKPPACVVWILKLKGNKEVTDSQLCDRFHTITYFSILFRFPVFIFWLFKSSLPTISG